MELSTKAITASQTSADLRAASDMVQSYSLRSIPILSRWVHELYGARIRL
jgi:hypothetical protein